MRKTAFLLQLAGVLVFNFGCWAVLIGVVVLCF